MNYAKNSKEIYQTKIKIDHQSYFRKDEQEGFEGEKLLEDKKFYYAYIKFDDEEGKYINYEAVKLCYASNEKDRKDWSVGTDDINFGNTNLTPEEIEEPEELITSTRDKEFLERIEREEKEEREELKRIISVSVKVILIIVLVILIIILIVNKTKKDKIERL